MAIKFIVEGKPVGKQRPRFGNGKIYTPKETTQYEKKVERACLRAMKDADALMFSEEDNLYINVMAYYEIPGSWTKKKKSFAAQGIEAPTVKPDIDNVLKIIMDGAQGIIFPDDKQFTRADIQKAYSTDPKVVVEIGKRL